LHFISRRDLLKDLSQAGERLVLRSDAFEIMQFRVGAKAAAQSNGPSVLRGTTEMPNSTGPERAFVKLVENRAVQTRRLTFDERMDLIQKSMGMLLNNTPWHMP
jgi:spore coat protein A